MAFRRSVLYCDLKNRTWWISIRKKRAVCKVSVLPSGLRRRNSSRFTRKRRATCRTNVQHCALRKRECCRNSSSWRKTLSGQCSLTFPRAQLSFTPTLVLPLSHLPDFCCTVQNMLLSLWSPTYWIQCCLVSGSSRAQNAELSSSLKALERSQQELEKRLVALQLQQQQDSTKLQIQLDEANSRSKALQREVWS